MTLPNKYLISGEGASATYSYQDIVDGTGIVEFYLSKAGVLSSATDTFLTTKRTSCGADLSSGGNHVNVSGSSSTTYTADLQPFNTPRYASGVAFFSAGTQKSSSGNHSLSVELFHVDENNNETSISSNVSSGVRSAARSWHVITLPVTPKQFKRGERLRMKMGVSNTSSGTLSTGTDPSGAVIFGSTVPAITTLYMPFKIDP